MLHCTESPLLVEPAHFLGLLEQFIPEIGMGDIRDCKNSLRDGKSLEIGYTEFGNEIGNINSRYGDNFTRRQGRSYFRFEVSFFVCINCMRCKNRLVFRISKG